MIKRLLAWVAGCWEALFYLPLERPAAKRPAPGQAEDANSVGMVL